MVFAGFFIFGRIDYRAVGAPNPHGVPLPLPDTLPGHLPRLTPLDYPMQSLLPRNKITITENRQRQTFDAQKEDDLRSSIELNGLLHAVVVREVGDKIVLVAGETRIRQMDDIWALGGTFKYNGEEVPSGMVPVMNLGAVTELEAEEAELGENLHRADLTWQERVDAEARLHKLRVKQSEAAIATIRKEVEEAVAKGVEAPEIPRQHTVADTAKELYGRNDGGYQAQARKSLLLAEHLDNPAIAKAKTADEALKILKKQEAQERHVQLAVAVGKTFNSEAHTLLNGSCLELMAKPEMRGRFDVILTDPPYGMGADNFGDGGGKLVNSQHHYDDSYESWQELVKAWAPLTIQVTKPQAHLYAFCDFDRFHELKQVLSSVGWNVFRTPIIVHKVNSGRAPRPEHGPRRQYELCLYAIKGGKQVNAIRPDVISAEADQNMTHGAQKPVAIYLDLLQRSVLPGDEVLDCFAGSGTIIPAAHTLKCSAVAMEQEKEYFGMCLNRVKLLKSLENNLGLSL